MAGIGVCVYVPRPLSCFACTWSHCCRPMSKYRHVCKEWPTVTRATCQTDDWGICGAGGAAIVSVCMAPPPQKKEPGNMAIAMGNSGNGDCSCGYNNKIARNTCLEQSNGGTTPRQTSCNGACYRLNYRGVGKNRTPVTGTKLPCQKKKQYGCSNHAFQSGWLQDRDTEPVCQSLRKLPIVCLRR
jgi:hypothetical protein